MPKPHRNSGLAAVNLGSKSGYRIFYHNADWQIHQILYDPAGKAWSYGGVVYPSPVYTSALSAQFSGTSNISVVFPKDANNIGVARYDATGEWQIGE